MDNLAELLRGLDRSRLDEAMALLQSLRNDQASQDTESAKQQAGGSPPAGGRSPAIGDASQAAAEPPEAGQIAKASSAETESSPVDEDDTPLAVLGQVLSAEERKNIRDAQKAEREAEREARKKMKDDELQFLKLEADGRKAVMDAERDERRSMRDSEREDRKAAREADKEARRKEQEAEREQRQRAREAELEAKQKAREAEKEALKIPKEAANSLAVFGFLSSAVKTDSKKNKLFSAFVQDKRIVPPALQFWAKPDEAELHNEEDASVVNVPASEAHRILLRDGENSRSRFVDEESSLLHAPICVEQQTAASKPEACVRDFNAMIEASNAPGARPHALLRECGCTFHVAVTAPYASFDNEAVFSGFFAIGYDPCQSRPPYFGTYNHLQEGNLNEVELLQMARFPVGGGIPRLTNIDYEYDSGDDWDVMEGDEDIAASTSEDSEANSDLNSLDSSDLDFINDDDEDDSDCDIQRRIMEGRQRRLFRLRNKDKLVPSYSGPFVGIANDEHPLRSFDEMERIAPLTSAYFSSLLETELNALASGNSGIPAVGDEDLSPEEREAKQQRALMEAALKNRREMTDGELKALHDLVRTNAKISSKMIITALREQQLCIGVAQAEMARTIRRFYERRRGSLVLRDEPWAATDERLFTPATTAASATSKKAKSTENADQTKAVGEEEDGDGDAEKEKMIEKTEVETTGPPSPAPAAPPACEKLVVEETQAEPLAHSSAEAKEEHVPRAKQMTLMELMPKVSAARDAKRQRENEQAEDQDGGVSTTVVD